MKKCQWIVLFSICVCFIKTTQAITQEIRYSCPEATEVYIVWGINNWQMPESKNIPPGSYIKDNLVYTSMTKKEALPFCIQIEAEPGHVIDYAFWIKKGLFGKQADAWDTNAPHQKDYHTFVTDNTITLVESKVKVRPKEALSILDFAYLLFAASLLAYCIIYFIQKFWFKHTSQNHPVLIIICTASSLLIGLFLIRPSVFGISWDLYSNPLKYINQAMWAVFYDFVYICFLTLLFILLIFALKKYPRAQKWVCYSFIGLCCVSLIAGIFNIRIVDMLGKPFNYQWLYYSNFLKGADAQAAISANISSTYILRIISICLSAFFLGLIVLKGISLLLYNSTTRKIAIVIVILAISGYSVTAHKKLQAQQWNYDRLANPVTAFIESVNPFAPNPDLFTMQVTDSLKFKPKNVLAQKPVSVANGKIKNVIIFVLESTPAEYIETYGSKYPVSPNIKKYEKQSITFENIYAHAPATNLSMVSLLNSVYPWLSFNSLTEEHPDLHVPSISTELKQRGYRTAFFNSADNRYQKADEFLSYRKFDMIRDCNDKSCSNERFEYTDEKKNFLNGKDDACTGNELTDWISNDTSKPFFCVMWTYQTHYPYFYNGRGTTYETNDSIFNRYLNALQYGDAVLGKLLEDLEKRQLAESTLIVVIGDHGEAFGRHGQTTHGREIYEENLHVPCILINPFLKEERKKEIGGIVDIAPTIMNTLGFENPTQWQGESLFSKTQNSRAYFFAPWSDYLFGFREGSYKYIYNATKNETEIYNLKEDPYEERNIINEKLTEVNVAHQRMAAWAQYVNDATDKLLKQ